MFKAFRRTPRDWCWGGSADVPLYVEPVGERLRSVPVARMQALLYAIYRRMYRLRFPLREPAFRRMLASLEGRCR